MPIEKQNTSLRLENKVLKQLKNITVEQETNIQIILEKRLTNVIRKQSGRA